MESNFALECELEQQVKTSFRITHAWGRLSPVEKASIEHALQTLVQCLYAPSSEERQDNWSDLATLSALASSEITHVLNAANFPGKGL